MDKERDVKKEVLAMLSDEAFIAEFIESPLCSRIAEKVFDELGKKLSVMSKAFDPLDGHIRPEQQEPL